VSFLMLAVGSAIYNVRVLRPINPLRLLNKVERVENWIRERETKDGLLARRLL
jgi:hypothetical protein